MNPSEIAVHILNFIAPALWTGLLITMGTRLLGRGSAARQAWWMQWGVLSTAGLIALTSCLWLTGHDGKMISYIALVLVCAATQFGMARLSGS